MRGEQIMKEALKVINGERQSTYGSPEDTHSAIATMWWSYLKARGLAGKAGCLVPSDVANMMVLLKVARQAGGKGKRDNYVDMLGYAALAADMEFPPDGDGNEQDDARR